MVCAGKEEGERRGWISLQPGEEKEEEKEEKEEKEEEAAMLAARRLVAGHSCIAIAMCT